MFAVGPGLKILYINAEWHIITIIVEVNRDRDFLSSYSCSRFYVQAYLKGKESGTSVGKTSTIPTRSSTINFLSSVTVINCPKFTSRIRPW